MILSPAPVVTKVAQLGQHFETTFNGRQVVVGFAINDGEVQIVSVLRDASGMGFWQDINTPDEWKESVKAEILNEIKEK